MSSLTLDRLPSERLPLRVAEAIRERWVPPAPSRVGHLAPEKVEETARAVLDAMLTRPYRVTPMPEPDEYAQLLARVRHWVVRGQPIRVRIGYGPMKNLNAARESRADWAEFFALCHLCTWHNKVQALYPPGLQITIVFDDSTILMANGHDRKDMTAYMDSVWRLVQALGYQTFITGTMRQSSFAWIFRLGLYRIAEGRVRRWEADPLNREKLERMNAYAERNVIVPPGLSEEEQHRHVLQASHRYRVYWEALQLSGLTEFGHNLVAMYLDGNQHHIRQSAAFHLTTLGKGQVAQPWQGEGVLLDNGHGRLIPSVLTQGRRERWVVQEVHGLEIAPLEGFTSISVCREEAQIGRGSGEHELTADPARPAHRPR